MRELEQAVSNAFSNIVASGAIERAIEEKLTTTITSIIDDSLRSYSDFGKQLGEQVKTALQVDLSRIGLPSYNDFIMKVVRAKVSALTQSAIAQQVEKQLEALLEPAPAEITLSALVDQFIKGNDDRYGCSCDAPDRITLHVQDTDYGSNWIALDKDDDKSEYECEIRFGVSKDTGRMFGLTLRQQKVQETLFLDPYGFERSILQMHLAGTKVIIDRKAYEIDTYYPGRGG
ncbi:hypothetical protein [Burkholderia glumae]|nr:hypothetical protein [Burkholderia glumae]PJO24865.1 hypothetical protein Y5A_000175 [Burkholderia glumae AU6208]QHE11828.1 hypothetical protein GQR88_16405 [Burkholderia glumae AU6208]QHE12100.1 hypothetical protein GQR88_16820 [Burkholderia glumae AU6208]